MHNHETSKSMEIEECKNTEPAKFNGTVTLSKTTDRNKQIEAGKIWSEVLRKSPTRIVEASSSNNKQSWADEVEEEEELMKSKRSIWDDFNISKLANAGYKLDYVAPSKSGAQQVMEIGLDDI